jgi:hypothetical protein
MQSGCRGDACRKAKHQAPVPLECHVDVLPVAVQDVTIIHWCRRVTHAFQSSMRLLVLTLKWNPIFFDDRDATD